MTQLDSKASLVAHGGSPSQRLQMDVGQTADFRVDEDAGWMRIEVNTTDGEDDVNVTRSLGAVVYERGDETVAYQGGGVWRSAGDGTWMVSPPEFHYRGRDGTATLTLPLVTIEDSDGRLGDTVHVSETGRTSERLFPSENGSNPLVGGNVTVTVQSEYAGAWGRFFESRTSATVTEVSDERVQVKLQTSTVHPTLDSGVSATGRSELRMGGIDQFYADSYDSSGGVTYESQDPGDSAHVQTRGEFALTRGGGGGTDSITIRGDLSAESYDIPPGQEDKLNVTGERRTETEFGDLNPVSGEITRRITAIEDEDLATNGDYRSDGIALSGTEEEVINGDTYVDGDVSVTDDATLRVRDGATLHVAGGLTVEEGGLVELDTSGGDVRALFEDSTALSGSGAIEARGDGLASLYVDDELSLQGTSSVTTVGDTRLNVYNTGDIELDDEVRIAAADDVSSNFWLYSSADEIDIEGDEGDGIAFTGVFYAPQSDAELDDKMTIKGSFNFQTFAFNDGDIDIHYDESLRTLRPFGGSSVPVVSHLHVSTHGVVIESD